MHRSRAFGCFTRRTICALGLTACVLGVGAGAARAEEGITDKEVRIAGSYPMSGPLSSFGLLGTGAQIYFKYLNETKGGALFADGKRRIVNFLTEDDAFLPARALANAQKFVSKDRVFAIMSNVGSAQAIAMREYLNEERVPQVFIYASPNTFSDDHDKFPMTGPSFMLPDPTEATMAARFIKGKKPNGKVAILNLNNLGGRDFAKAFERELAGSDLKVVARATFEPTATTVDSEVASLAQSGADVFVQYTAGKSSAQAIRKRGELGWKPLHYVIANASQMQSSLAPAGLENAEGLYTMKYFKDPSDKSSVNDPEIKFYYETVKKYGDGADPTEDLLMHGFAMADLITQVMEKSQPTRESFLNTIWTFKGRIFGTQPGVMIQMGNGDNYPMESAVPMQFHEGRWQPAGDTISLEGKSRSLR